MESATKVYVNGSIYAGKTRLISALRGVYYNPETDKPAPRNRGPSATAMLLDNDGFSLYRELGAGLPIVVWSFGGHGFFTGATDAFRDERAIFIVVVNGTHHYQARSTLPVWTEVSVRLGARPDEILYVITGVTEVPEALRSHPCLAKACCVSLLEDSAELQRLRDVIVKRAAVRFEPYSQPLQAKQVRPLRKLGPILPAAEVKEDLTDLPVIRVCDAVITDPLWLLRVMDVVSLLDETGHPRVWQLLKQYLGGRYSQCSEAVSCVKQASQLHWLTVEGLELLLRLNSQQLFHTQPLVLPLNADGRCEACCPGSYSSRYCEFVSVTRGMCNGRNHSRVRLNRLLGGLEGLSPGTESYIPAVARQVMQILVHYGAAIPFPDAEGTLRYYLPHLVSDLRTASPPTENVSSVVLHKRNTRYDAIPHLLAQLYRQAIWTGEEIFGTDWGYHNVRFCIPGSTITVVEHKEGCIIAASPPCDIAAVFDLPDVMTPEEEQQFYAAEAYQHRTRFVHY